LAAVTKLRNDALGWKNDNKFGSTSAGIKVEVFCRRFDRRRLEIELGVKICRVIS